MTIEGITIDGIRAAYESRDLSAVELTREYLRRIERFDSGAEGLRSVSDLNPEALAIAELLDRELAAGRPRGPLHGVPLLLKCNIDTADSMPTSAGSLALGDALALRDAPVAAALRAAGAVVIGKTNMTEFANFMDKGMPAGYSSRGGQVRSPYDAEESPWGSSAGSAVAVASDFCAAAVGTDTCNSIIAPAERNGIVGIRPSSGLVDNRGIVPISRTLDTAGPMARTVRDAAILLDAMAGAGTSPPDSFARATLETARGEAPIAIGVNEADILELSGGDASELDSLLATLARAGALIVRGIDVPRTKFVMPIMAREFKRCLEEYLAEGPRSSAIRSLGDIVAFNERNAESALRYGQSFLVEALDEDAEGGDRRREYDDLMRRREADMARVGALLAGLDALLLPVPTNLPAYAGCPCIAIPTGLEPGKRVPSGISLMGAARSERRLLRAAAFVERVAGYRRGPDL